MDIVCQSDIFSKEHKIRINRVRKNKTIHNGVSIDPSIWTKEPSYSSGVFSEERPTRADQTLKKVNRTSQVDYYFRNVGMQMACLTFFLKIKDAKWLSLLYFEKKMMLNGLPYFFFHFKI